MSFEIYSSGVKIVTVETGVCADTISPHGPGSYTYKVGAAAFASCAEPVTTTFSAGAAMSSAARRARDSRAHGGRRHHRPTQMAHREKKR